MSTTPTEGARQLLHTMRNQGVTVEVLPDRLRVIGETHSLTAGQRDALRDNRLAIRELVESERLIVQACEALANSARRQNLNAAEEGIVAEYLAAAHHLRDTHDAELLSLPNAMRRWFAARPRTTRMRR